MLDCSKIAYANRWQALVAMRVISRAYEERGRQGPRGVYLCRPCGSWHVTSAKRVQTAPWTKPRTTR